VMAKVYNLIYGAEAEIEGNFSLDVTDIDVSSLNSTCYLRFRKHIEGIHNTLSSKFRDRFLFSPCQGCGSNCHPLLSREKEVDNVNGIRYKYACSVVKGSTLYTNNFDGVRILYFLGTMEFAEECGYDLAQARSRQVLRGFKETADRRSHVEKFLTKVDTICQWYNDEEDETEGLISDPMLGRKRRLFSPSDGEESVEPTGPIRSTARSSTSLDSTNQIVSEYRRVRRRFIQRPIERLQPGPQLPRDEGCKDSGSN